MTGKAGKYPPDINAIKSQLEEIISATTPSSQNIFNALLTDVWLPWAHHRESLQGPADREQRNISYKYGNALRPFAIAYFGFAIPVSEALSTILSDGRNIVELGSGQGYWASLLEAASGNVTAVDSGRYEHRHFAATIEQDGAAYLQEHGGAADSTLLICWGHRGSGMDEALAEVKGEFLAVVGEPSVEGCTWWPTDDCFESDSEDDAEYGSDDDGDGCPASASLNKVMNDDHDDASNEQPEEAGVQRQWRRICTVTIPEWEYIYDRLAIFERI